MKRLLYLGISFPPGAQVLFPGVNPAGHAVETYMVAALRARFDIKSATVLPVILPGSLTVSDPLSGVAHDLVLLDRPPEFWHRLRSLARLKRQYLQWRAAGWVPDAVLVYNTSPVYNNFLRWLKRQHSTPKLVLWLLDSEQLGRELPALKRFRYRFKPLAIPDDEMIREFDACIGLSQFTERFFTPRNIPFLWMPGGCVPERALAPKPTTEDQNSAIRFCYFGALATHSGIMALVEAFLASPIPNELHICGYGRLSAEIAELATKDKRLKFHGLMATPDDCLRFGQSCDVLVNPRPLSHGNDNNFPSKLFEYALCGTAILTTGFAGAREVLGSEAFYLDENRLIPSLTEQFILLSKIPRNELRRRGITLQERVVNGYSWRRQTMDMADFISKLS